MNNLIKDFKSDTKNQIIDSFTLFISSTLNSQSFQRKFSQNKVNLFPKTFSDVFIETLKNNYDILLDLNNLNTFKTSVINHINNSKTNIENH